MHNYMDYQQEISWKMRRTLVEWLIEVHAEYDLRPETLYLGINIMDRYLSRRVVPRMEFQLLGVTALWIAAKYEEVHGRVPTLQKLAYVCCNAYREQDFVQMELRLLNELEFNLGHPTPEAFLKHHCAMLKAQAERVGADPTEHIALARYLMEITLVHRRFLAARPSVIALASFLLADKLMGKSVWKCNDELLLHTVQQIGECIATAPKAIYQKYANRKYEHVSVIARSCIEGWVSGCLPHRCLGADFLCPSSTHAPSRPQHVPPPINTTFTQPSNPYPSPPSRFSADCRSSSQETLVDWPSSPSRGHPGKHQPQAALVVQPIAFAVPVQTTVLYSCGVGYMHQPQLAEPQWSR
ncbi:Cyclin, N-terminal domain-containing protein [Hyaloraphidium curvatum]|nr:Cyclin, N-terminal domain-containing protein [Hyaloraphidium curvatum]